MSLPTAAHCFNAIQKEHNTYNLSPPPTHTHPHTLTHTGVLYRNVELQNILWPALWHLRSMATSANSSAHFVPDWMLPDDALANCTARHQFAPSPPSPSLSGLYSTFSMPVLNHVLCVFIALLLSHFHLLLFYSVLLWLRALCLVFYYIVWAICFLLSLLLSPSLSIALSLSPCNYEFGAIVRGSFGLFLYAAIVV